MEKILNVPYKSQWDTDAGMTNNDCGPASAAMILNYFGENLTTNQVFEKTEAGKGLINIGQMQKAIKAFGYDSEFLTNQTPAQLKTYLNQDLPVIALVHYGSLNSTQDKTFKVGHFFTVVGYRDDGYFVNDPNFKGDLRSHGDHHFYTKDEFEKAWRDCSLDKNPINSFLVIKRKSQPQVQSNPSTQGINFEQWYRSLLGKLGLPDNKSIGEAEGHIQSLFEKISDRDKQIEQKNNELRELKEKPPQVIEKEVPVRVEVEKIVEPTFTKQWAKFFYELAKGIDPQATHKEVEDRGKNSG